MPISYQPDARETGPSRNGDHFGLPLDEARLNGAGGDTGVDTGTRVKAETEIQRFTKIALQMARQAERSHEQTFTRKAGGWQRAYRAYRNEHFAGSKYLGAEFKERSKVFIPKTRSAVRKNQTSCAAALFSTDEVVSVRPERDDDDRQRASASLINQIMNYRLDRTSPRGGIPWFLIAMGMHQDAQQTGICVTKQDWEFEEREIDRKPVMAPMPDEATGEPVIGIDGQPIMVDTGETEPVMKTLKDRPLILPIPPENVIIESGASWYEPAQSAGFLILRFPMALGAVKTMIKKGRANPKARVKWLEVSDDALKRAVTAYDAKGVRMAREGGGDRLDLRTRQVDEYSICWLHECFMRFEGCDYVFWSVGSEVFLSEVMETEEAYPAFKGARPVVYGYGAIESHSITPTSPVESWQPLQQEINDLRNLRLDAAKQSVLPFATVKAGKQVDVSILKKLAPGANIMVKDHEDIQFRELPNGVATTLAESAGLNVDMDELSGSFSGSSVSTNRQLNETVGGMTLLSGSANATTEYDLRIFVESSIEPVLRQYVHLIQYYENDANVIAIAAQRAELFDKFGIDEVTDDLLTNEVTVKVNVGTGATDPDAKMRKLGNAFAMLKDILPVSEPKVVPNSEEIVSEVMGATGHKDGKRFFHWPDPNQPEEKPPNPDEIKAKVELDKANISADASIQVAQINAQAGLSQSAQQMDADREAHIRELLMGSTGGAVGAPDPSQTPVTPMGPDGQPILGPDGQPLPPQPPPDPAMVKEQSAAALAQARFEHEKEMAQKGHDLAREKMDREFSLKAAAHNRQMVDESTQAASGEDAKAMREPSGLESLAATVSAMIEAQAQQSQQMVALVAAIAQGQQHQATEFGNLVSALAAPKHIDIVRGRDGKATGANVSPA